jgi:hypothetical protein
MASSFIIMYDGYALFLFKKTENFKTIITLIADKFYLGMYLR